MSLARLGRAGGLLALLFALAGCTSAQRGALPTLQAELATALPALSATGAAISATSIGAPAPAPSAAPAAPTPPPDTLPGTPASGAPSMPAGLPQGTVSAVVDGDTLDVEVGGEVSRVRMIGVDTPETVRPNTPVECFGREASAFSKQLLTGQAVLLEEDPSQDSRDRYGRLLRFVWLADGRMANYELVAQGFAYEYTYDQAYKYQGEFKAAQQAAQAGGRGLWATSTCAGSREAGVAATPSPVPARCAAPPDPSAAPNSPIAIVALDKRAESVTLKNVGAEPVNLDGWRLCSLRGEQSHPVGGALAPGEQRTFPGAQGASIWSNGERDDAALFDPSGALIAYWADQP